MEQGCRYGCGRGYGMGMGMDMGMAARGGRGERWMDRGVEGV
jgi:hypothetical protein